MNNSLKHIALNNSDSSEDLAMIACILIELQDFIKAHPMATAKQLKIELQKQIHLEDSDPTCYWQNALRFLKDFQG